MRPTKGLVLDRKVVADRIRELSQKHGLHVDPEVKIENLSVGVRQRVEIIKVLYRHANILILDEPTAVLTPQEADDLFGILRSLRDQGVSIIFISHKLREVLDLADRVTVIRRGTGGRRDQDRGRQPGDAGRDDGRSPGGPDRGQDASPSRRARCWWSRT